MAVQAGQKLKKTIPCGVCGGDCKMSVSKNMTIFAWCITPAAAGEKETCGFRGFLGRPYSRELIRDYNKNYEEYENVEHEETAERQEETKDSGSSRDGGEHSQSGDALSQRKGDGASSKVTRQDQRGSSFGAKLNHFFTADE